MGGRYNAWMGPNPVEPIPSVQPANCLSSEVMSQGSVQECNFGKNATSNMQNQNPERQQVARQDKTMYIRFVDLAHIEKNGKYEKKK